MGGGIELGRPDRHYAQLSGAAGLDLLEHSQRLQAHDALLGQGAGLLAEAGVAGDLLEHLLIHRLVRVVAQFPQARVNAPLQQHSGFFGGTGQRQRVGIGGDLIGSVVGHPAGGLQLQPFFTAPGGFHLLACLGRLRVNGLQFAADLDGHVLGHGLLSLQHGLVEGVLPRSHERR